MTLNWAQFMALPQFEDVSDFHCVTTWSQFDMVWEGVAFLTLADLVKPKAEASHVFFKSYDGYSTNNPLEVMMDDDVLIAHSWNGQPLAVEHGGPARVIVNCVGAALAGGQVPARIGQGLRASAAFSTLVLDNANSTAVLLHGQLGKGVETVELERRMVPARGREATRIEAAHDGYAARFGLTHQRILTLSADGTELAGEDILVPAAKNGKRGKIAFAIRFHLGRGVEVQLSGDRRGASLLLPDGRLWQFRMGGDRAGAGEITLSAEDSLWVDGEGRPHATEQLVIEGLALRSGGQFSWLLKKTG